MPKPTIGPGSHAWNAYDAALLAYVRGDMGGAGAHRARMRRLLKAQGVDPAPWIASLERDRAEGVIDQNGEWK